jgi:uncharacterized iron-regulated membrane protein
MSEAERESAAGSRRWPDYRAVWRWHFYAGLFCIPFVVVLSISGSIYLFKQEIESWIDRPYDGLAVRGEPEPASRQIAAAISAFPGSTFQAYELPQSGDESARVIIRRDGEAVRVYVHPETLQVLYSVAEEDRPMRWLFRLHGELLMGNRGSALVELASSWAIVMIVTGLYLWWPRGASRLGGIVYPRLGRGPRVFWRDIHAVTGLWVSGFALVLLLTGLPWAKFWGDYLRNVRRLTGTASARQDWTNGAVPRSIPDPGESHEGHGDLPGGGRPERERRPRPPVDLSAVDRIAATVKPLGLQPPVVIAPPGARSFGGPMGRASTDWTAKSMTANRPYRTDLVMDGATGAIKDRKGFGDRHPIDRAVSVGIAFHEGRLFGLPNQLLGLFTAAGLVLVSVSSVVLWLRRRDPGVLGAPRPHEGPAFSPGLLVIAALLGAYLPLFGASLLAVLAVEKIILRRIPLLNRWLGLAPSEAWGEGFSSD